MTIVIISVKLETDLKTYLEVTRRSLQTYTSQRSPKDLNGQLFAILIAVIFSEPTRASNCVLKTRYYLVPMFH